MEKKVRMVAIFIDLKRAFIVKKINCRRCREERRRVKRRESER